MGVLAEGNLDKELMVPGEKKVTRKSWKINYEIIDKIYLKQPYVVSCLEVWPPRFQSLLIMGWCSSKTRA